MNDPRDRREHVIASMVARAFFLLLLLTHVPHALAEEVAISVASSASPGSSPLTQTTGLCVFGIVRAQRRTAHTSKRRRLP